MECLNIIVVLILYVSQLIVLRFSTLDFVRSYELLVSTFAYVTQMILFDLNYFHWMRDGKHGVFKYHCCFNFLCLSIDCS